MSDMEKIFSEYTEAFTIYVVEQRFAVGRGHEYFKQFQNKENFINSNAAIKKRITKILNWIQKKIPNASELIEKCFSAYFSPTKIGIVELIVSLNKLFTLTEHQAAGPEVLDPIIIEEANIKSNYLTQLITLHKESITQPTIIIILKDNDFDRAKKLISNCPDGINVKLIRNSGEAEIYKVINSGANNIEAFIDSFARQCFSTCSKTERNIILNSQWNHKDIVHTYSPFLFKVRTNLLYDEKEEALFDVDHVINGIKSDQQNGTTNELLLASLELISKLNRVYCNDFGGSDIIDAWNIARELDIDLLKAHVYRYSSFMSGISRNEQKDLLKTARDIFEKNNVEDHALYCQNNYLVHNFYSDRVNPRPFRELQNKATSNVPGMVGMSIILNNVGVAYLYTRDISEAIYFFNKGLDYSKERIVQRIGIKSNILVARACAYESVDEKEIRQVLDAVFANFGTTYLPFIAANYAVNMLLITLKQHRELVPDILREYRIHEIISSALADHMLGTGSLTQQLIVLNSKYPDLGFSDFPVPTHMSALSGIRGDFIMKNGYNPIIFNAWL